MKTDSSTTLSVHEKDITGIASKLQISSEWDKMVKLFLEENSKFISSSIEKISTNSTTTQRYVLGWVDKAEILTKEQLIEILKSNLG